MGAVQPDVSSIDDDIAAQPPEVQAILRKIRTTMRKSAPTAIEKISYRMPAFALNGILIYFAAFKQHIGLYPPFHGGDKTLMKQKAPFEGPKGKSEVSARPTYSVCPYRPHCKIKSTAEFGKDGPQGDNPVEER